MNIWIYDSTAGWNAKMPFTAIDMLVCGNSPQSRFLIVSKCVDGLCFVVFQPPAAPNIHVAMADLTEQQARRIAIAYLEQNALLAEFQIDDLAEMEELKCRLEDIANSPGAEANQTMFLSTYRGNYRTNINCVIKAVEYLRAYRLSVGAGYKVIVSDSADLQDESDADIILSATGKEAKQFARGPEESGSLIKKAATAVTSVVGVFVLLKRLIRK